MHPKLTKYLETDDQGVSPVIGVILMLAITVILSTIVGTFVLGLDTSNPEPYAKIDTSQGEFGTSGSPYDSEPDIRMKWTMVGNADNLYIQPPGYTWNDIKSNPTLSDQLDLNNEKPKLNEVGDEIVIEGGRSSNLQSGDNIVVYAQMGEGNHPVFNVYTVS